MAAIDQKVIEELRALQTGGSPTFLAELIDIFLKEQVQHLERLRKAYEDRDVARVERVAHTMKGSCGNLGAKELSRVCAELQDVASEGDWARMAEFVARIERDAAAVESELQAEKARRP